MDDNKLKFSIDWRVAIGLTITIAWFTAGFTYLIAIVGWGKFIHLPTADLGSFLEGAFAPLAFLWLVIGHFMQQKEISANTRAIGIQEKSARRLEMHSQRDSYFKLLMLIQDQLGSISAYHYMSVSGPTGSGEMTVEDFTEGRSMASSGDYAYFIRKMTTLAYTNQGDQAALDNIFFGTDIRRRHTENYAHTFERLLAAAKDVDTNDMISDALLMGSAQGRQYRIIQHVKGDNSYDLELIV